MRLEVVVPAPDVKGLYAKPGAVERQRQNPSCPTLKNRPMLLAGYRRPFCLSRLQLSYDKPTTERGQTTHLSLGRTRVARQPFEEAHEL